MQNLRVKKLGFLVLSLVVISILYWSMTAEQKLSDKQILVFHPDAVTGLEWTTPGQKKISFQRKDRNSAWESQNPMDNEIIRRIQFVINALAIQTAESTPVKALDNGAMIVMTFGNQQQWRGSLTSAEIRWQQNEEFKSFPLTERQMQLVQSGEFVFENPSWRWCKKRPQSIKINYKNQKFVLTDRKGKWEMLKDGRESVIDSSRVEAWLGRQCTLVFQRYIDKSIHNPFSLINFNSMDVVWSDQSEDQYPLQGTMIQISKNQIGVIEDAQGFFSVFQ